MTARHNSTVCYTHAHTHTHTHTHTRLTNGSSAVKFLGRHCIAAYCYSGSGVVCLCAGHDCEPCKKAEVLEGRLVRAIETMYYKGSHWHTDFNEDTTNESASVACSNIRL